MQVVTLEFENEKSLNEALDHLWNRLGITGELSVKPLSGGVYRLEIASERGLRPNTLEKIGGRLVE